MTFLELYGTELDRELGSADRDQLFTTVRRKAAINAAQLEWVKRTECLSKQTTIPMVDETQEYDIEATVTDFLQITKQGVSIRITPASGSVRYLEGDDLEVTSVERLNVEEPSWRAVSAGTPTKVYQRRNGGTVNLGFHPAPAITAGDTWVVLLPYVIIPAEMSLDAAVPFTVSSNAIASLAPYHRALVYYAAADLEKFRKDTERAAAMLESWEIEILRFGDSMKPKGGQRVRMAVNYRGRASRGSSKPLDPRVWP